MGPAQRFLAAGVCVAAAEVVLGIALSGTAPYFWTCAAVTVAFAIVARRLVEPPPGGRGRDIPGDAEPPEPPWWPEFEAQFRDHLLTARDPRA